MIIDCNNILIAEWNTIEEVVPYPQYNSGAKDRNNPVYVYPAQSYSNPVLALDFDILNEYGFGLKKGYYEIATDEQYETLMFVQGGVIKAKIPVIKNELINDYGSSFEWDDNSGEHAEKDLTKGVPVFSRAILTKTYSDKELKKRYKKYKKGMDPSTYFHSKVSIEYDTQQGYYKVIWEKYNTRLIGVIKL